LLWRAGLEKSDERCDAVLDLGSQRGMECREGRGEENEAIFRAFMRAGGIPKHWKPYQVFSTFSTPTIASEYDDWSRWQVKDTAGGPAWRPVLLFRLM